MLIKQDKECLWGPILHSLLQGAFGLCEGSVAVPLIDLEELALSELLYVAPVLEVGQVLQNQVVIRLTQVHLLPHPSTQLALVALAFDLLRQQFREDFDEFEEVFAKGLDNIGEYLMVLESKDE